ncbi:MAG: hypothetical protein JWO43_266 [Candidatus Adlerbacteria bacterium]|nr:hypothetical protein [Candidatus Adlerbacteria bacterium]
MKTLFITIYDSDTEKNILRSGVLAAILKDDIRAVLLIRGADRLEYYEKNFATQNVLVELLPEANSFIERLWYFIGWNTLPTQAVRVRRDRSLQWSLLRRVVASLFGLLGHLRIWRELLRLVYRYTPDTYAPALFEKYQPDLVFAPGMFSPEDFRLMRAARKRGVRSITTAKSWDVLTTKAFTRVKADRILVFNHFNYEEAVRIGDYAPACVTITGFPQFDIYTHQDIFQSREVFCAAINADPQKKIVLFGVPGDWKTPHSKDILAELDNMIEQGKFKKPLQVLARFHPKYSDSSEGLDARHIIFDRPGSRFSSATTFGLDAGVGSTIQWRFEDKDIVHLANSIHHSEVVVNTDSTLTLDAAANDKPSILIAYDGNAKLPYKESIAYIYERDHYQTVIKTGGVVLAHSHNELAQYIDTFVENPEHLRTERELLKVKLLYKLDGKSAERAGTAVVDMLK